MATLDAQFCSPEERLKSAASYPTLHCLTRNESIALSVVHPIPARDQMLTFQVQFVTQSGALSLFACLITYFLILVSITNPIASLVFTVRQRNIRHHSRINPGKWRLIKSPMDVYLVSDGLQPYHSNTDFESSCLSSLQKHLRLLGLASMGDGYNLERRVVGLCAWLKVNSTST